MVVTIPETRRDQWSFHVGLDGGTSSIKEIYYSGDATGKRKTMTPTWDPKYRIDVIADLKNVPATRASTSQPTEVQISQSEGRSKRKAIKDNKKARMANAMKSRHPGSSSGGGGPGSDDDNNAKATHT